MPPALALQVDMDISIICPAFERARRLLAGAAEPAAIPTRLALRDYEMAGLVFRRAPPGG